MMRNGGGAFTSPTKPASNKPSKEYKRPKYLEEEEEEFVAHRPKISSNLKTSSTVLDDDEDLMDAPKEVMQSTDESDSTSDDSGYVSTKREVGVGGEEGFLDVPRHGGSAGSPGVPGRPILHPARPSPQHTHGSKIRKVKSGDGLKQTVFGQKNSHHLVDTATQTANNASTQTSDNEDAMMRSGSPDYPMLLVNSHSIDPRRNYQQGVSQQHRRSVSWDPPSLVQALGGDAKNPKSMEMLSQILKEKRDQLLQRELEIKKEKLQMAEQQQRQQQQQQREREREREREEQLRIQEQQRLQQQREREEGLRIQEQQRLQEQQLRQQEGFSHSKHPHRRRESTTALSKLVMPGASMPPSAHIMPPPTSPHSAASAHLTQMSAHHHRSKSDPNVIPLLLRGLHSPQRTPGGPGYGSSPQLVSALAALNAQHAAAAAAAAAHQSPSSGLRTKSQQDNSPRTSSSLSSRKSLNVSSLPLSPPITEKQKELLELEKRIEAKQKQLQDKGYSVVPFVPREERRKDWSLEVKDDALLSSLEDIEEEIEQIKQRTIDIQGKVQLLERCVAPDPLTMMFGDHGTKRSKRISPYHPTSPTYVIDPPSTFASPHNESPYKRMHKHRPTSPTSYEYAIPIAPFPSSSFSSFHPPSSHSHPVRPTSRSSAYPSAPSPVPIKYTAPSPVPTIPMGPDMSKRMNLGPRSSAFSPPPTQQEDPSAPWSHSARSAFSPPPRVNSQEDMQVHWTRL